MDNISKNTNLIIISLKHSNWQFINYKNYRKRYLIIHKWSKFRNVFKFQNEIIFYELRIIP